MVLLFTVYKKPFQIPHILDSDTTEQSPGGLNAAWGFFVVLKLVVTARFVAPQMLCYNRCCFNFRCCATMMPGGTQAKPSAQDEMQNELLRDCCS